MPEYFGPTLDSPTLFETLGLDYERRLSMSGIMNVVQLVAVMVALVCIERFGRKTWLLVGSVGMTLSHVVVAAMIGQFALMEALWYRI